VEIVALGSPTGAPGGKPRYAPKDYYRGNFTVQVGAFKDQANAQQLQRRLARDYQHVHVSAHFNGAETFYRVRVGRATTLQAADRYEAIMIQNGFADAFVIAE
jgi:rare lipoprotein A